MDDFNVLDNRGLGAGEDIQAYTHRILRHSQTIAFWAKMISIVGIIFGVILHLLIWFAFYQIYDFFIYFDGTMDGNWLHPEMLFCYLGFAFSVALFTIGVRTAIMGFRLKPSNLYHLAAEQYRYWRTLAMSFVLMILLGILTFVGMFFYIYAEESAMTEPSIPPPPQNWEMPTDAPVIFTIEDTTTTLE